MTNWTRKRIQNKSISNKQVQKKDDKKEDKKKRSYTMLDVMTMVISTVAVVISLFSLYFSSYYDKKEYEYKLELQIEVSGLPDLEVDSSGHSIKPSMAEIHVNIVEKNNLEEAYVIYTDGEVERVEPEDIEDTLAGTIEYGIQEEPDIISGEYEYRYIFLYLKSLDGSCTLHLIYTKSSPGYMIFWGGTGVEVYGLQNSHENDAAYEGEKIMAQEYAKIIEEMPKYMIW